MGRVVFCAGASPERLVAHPFLVVQRLRAASRPLLDVRRDEPRTSFNSLLGLSGYCLSGACEAIRNACGWEKSNVGGPAPCEPAYLAGPPTFKTQGSFPLSLVWSPVSNLKKVSNYTNHPTELLPESLSLYCRPYQPFAVLRVPDRDPDRTLSRLLRSDDHVLSLRKNASRRMRLHITIAPR